MRRARGELIVAALFALLLASYVWYTQRVVRELRVEADRSNKMLALVIRGLSDTTQGAAISALLGLNGKLQEQGIPMVHVDPLGRVVGFANLPFEAADDSDPRILDHVAVLDRQNPPLREPFIGTIHYGNTRLIRRMRVIPLLQGLTGIILMVTFAWILRTRARASREHVWAGMARESAHQLGTPLSSLLGWVELLEERAEQDPGLESAVRHMRGDLVRLDRVAHRFERIGREPRLEPTDLTALVERVAAYFRARVPTLANTVRINVEAAGPLTWRVDPVLIEWALEVLAKNAIDALAGRGGTVTLVVAQRAESGVRIAVIDDGPGVPREMRTRIFEPGFTTKKQGWGIGLSLAKRIVEDNHDGTLGLVPSPTGAAFEIILS